MSGLIIMKFISARPAVLQN